MCGPTPPAGGDLGFRAWEAVELAAAGVPQVRVEQVVMALDGPEGDGDGVHAPVRLRPAEPSRSAGRRAGALGRVPGWAFFKSVYQTDLAAGEVLTEIRIPKPATGSGWSYTKFTRRAQDFAIVGIAVGPPNGAVAAKVGMAGMGLTPVRASAVEGALASGADDASAARSTAEGTSPVSDTFASAAYRRHLAGVLTQRALEEAMARRG
jgi:xanthine dehydrogenase iron-sulfur cluster and FAD-binding subunit A